MSSIWTYCDPAGGGYGLFKRILLKNLSERGWNTRIAEVPLMDEGAAGAIRRQYFEQPADWILLINQTAAQFCEYAKIPLDHRPLPSKKWVWFLDDPRFFVHQPLETDEFAFCFDETYVEWLDRFCPRGAGFLPLAADREALGAYREDFAHEVSFVGGVIDQSGRRGQLPPDMRTYVDRLAELKLEMRWKTFDELAAEHPVAPGKRIRITGPVAHYLYWEANNRRRVRVLEALSGYDFAIYGNEDWKVLLEGSPLLERFMGPADPLDELPSIFASSQINLNIHSIQCRGSLNQRDFNAPVCGGFLLSDWVPAAGRYFDPGIEAVYWSDTDDLRRKIDYYLARPGERARIVENGRARVSRDHTYARRTDDLLKQLGL